MALTLDGTNGIVSSGSITTQSATGVIFSDSSSLPAASSPYVLKNRIINGAMVIDQRNAGAATANTINGYTVDRWIVAQNNSTGKLIAQQNAAAVTPPAGFTNYLGVTSQSSYSVGSTDWYAIQHNIEGYNVADLDYGKATAKTCVLSFWVRSSLTGTFVGTFGNSASTRAYPFTYTISVANTWEQKTITVNGDTSGTWLTTNGVGLYLMLSLGMGSSFQTGTANNSWATSTTISIPSGGTSVVGTNGATFYITGVQLEQNTSATPFERRLYNQELANCQRYYQVLGKGLNGSPAYQIYSILTYEASATAWGTVPLKVTMRTQPTTAYSGTFTTSYGTQGTLLNDTNQTGPDNGVVGWSTGSGGTTGYSTYLRASNSTAAFISFSAEL